MSERVKNVFASVLLILLAASAFVAGYFTNDFIEMRRGEVTVSTEGAQDFALFWEAWGHVQANFIGELPTSKELTYGAIRGSVALLGDPYTFFVEPIDREIERQSLQGTFGGVGATVSRPEEGGPVFLEPIPGNPAAEAGILSGDALVAVDGEPITPEMTVEAVANLVRGDKGTVVVLTVIHPDETKPVDIEVERGDILIPSVSYRLLRENEQVGYIQLTRFSAESAHEIETAVLDLQSQGATQLILDLRGNGGGLLDAAVAVADHFLTDGPILYQQSRGQEERVYEATAETLAPDIPIMVLVDGGTASSSEILAGALQDRGRALLVGSTPTFGKGSAQLVYDLSDGSSVHVTASRWFTPDKHQLDQQGLTPDVLVTVTQEDIDNGRDAVLNQAVMELQRLAQLEQ
ncbi:MAG: S41 family peptidase [Ardenticatenaceae bacterium]|nr:S41 family peptidase [Anaerolineales bacterium]MCB8937471.1 S41 family peptidase [Ardenticatenaceae bacterium]MCB8975548.1 S41 family peptidase [Ardenticatenaceae bacterium]